jgi:hypothetical protein
LPIELSTLGVLSSIYFWGKSMNDLDVTGLVFTIPARVLRTTEQRQIDLTTIIKDRHVLDPAILEQKTPFFWDAEISSDLIDAYSSHMMLSTLSNFRDDAKTGVSYLPGHNHRELPFGRSLDAILEDTQSPQRTRVAASFYTLPGLKLNGVSTDDLIDGLRSGILKDVSVGFHQGESLCDLCQRSIWDWDCPHVPGMKYEVKEGDVMRVKLATYGVHNARLSEVSSVFDGATPRAEVIKAERESTEGRMRPDAVRLFEERYRVKLPVKRSFPVVKPEKGKQMEFEQQINQIREVLGIAADADIVASVLAVSTAPDKLRAVEQQLTEAQARVKELEPQAADGRTYRDDLITEALAEGVRAYGDKFNQATYEGMLRGASLEIVKQMRTDWASVGNARFAGGRQSTDQGEQAPGKQTKRARVPASAYKS